MRRLLVVLLAAGSAAMILASNAAGWSWPADGEVVRPFVLGDDPYAGGQHRGIDVAGEEGSAVLAPASGTVTFAGYVPNNGRTVTIRTPDDYYAVTLVGLGAIGVSRGSSIEEGDTVGTIAPAPEDGTPANVHLGVRIAAEANGYIDPLTLLPARTQEPESGQPGGDESPEEPEETPTEDGDTSDTGSESEEESGDSTTGTTSEDTTSEDPPSEETPSEETTPEETTPEEPAPEETTPEEPAPEEPAPSEPAPPEPEDEAPTDGEGQHDDAEQGEQEEEGSGEVEVAAGAGVPEAGEPSPETEQPAVVEASQGAASISRAPAPAIGRELSGILPAAELFESAVVNRAETNRAGLAAVASATLSSRLQLSSKRGDGGHLGVEAVREFTSGALGGAALKAVRERGSSESEGLRWIFVSALTLLAFGAASAFALWALRILSHNRPPRMMMAPDGVTKGTDVERESGEDTGCRGLALRKRPASHRARSRVRRPVRHIRSLSQVQGQRRAHGLGHRRAWDAGHGCRRAGRALAS